MVSRRFAYDIETDGLLAEVSRLHSLVMLDLDTGELISVAGHETDRLAEALHLLDGASLRVGHNIVSYDEQVLGKLFPGKFTANPSPERLIDTMLMSQLIWPNLIDLDAKLVKSGKLPPRLRGGHGLEAWGHRLGVHKGDYAKAKAAEIAQLHPGWTKAEITRAVWSKWTKAMQSYCEQDVVETKALYDLIVKKGYPDRARLDEMACAILCARITETGFGFDQEAAVKLYGELAQLRHDLEQELKQLFGSWIGGDEEPTVPVSRTSNGGLTTWGENVFISPDGIEFADYEAGDLILTKGGSLRAGASRAGWRREFRGFPYTKVRVVRFNPKSRAHISDRLIKLRGWKPVDKTETGEWKVDEAVLGKLDPEKFPEAALLTRYLLVSKRLGQLAEGREAWIRAAGATGRVHGAYKTAGAVTRRATHRSPNIAQVPKVKLDKTGHPKLGEAGGWGYESRALFRPNHPGWVQVGVDASGLELRCLAHYMARWDDGAYGKVLLEEDIHTVNQLAAGLPSRDNAKTFIYAFLYGAGDAKIGSIVGGSAAHGKKLKAKFLAGLPAMGNLVKAVQDKAGATRTLLTLDGAPMHVRSSHAALNTLLQGAGALVCKRWIVTTYRMLQERGLVWGKDYEFHAWVHDELQASARTADLAEMIRSTAAEAMADTEAYFNFRIPLATEGKIGANWAECH